jgi:hypothetical protein
LLDLVLMPLRFACVGVVLSALVSVAPAAQSARNDRLLNTIVGQDAEVRLPPTAENIGLTLASIAKSTGALIGFETVMDDELWSGSDQFGWSPRGITLAQALDQVVAMDARYEWREHEGVIHVRPKTAFADPRHFLNQRVAKFELKDAIPLHATFEVHRVYRKDCEIRHLIYTTKRDEFLSDGPASLRMPVSVSLTNVTVLGIMDAVIKAHGQLYWNVTYRLPPDITKPESAMYEYAVFSFHDRPSVGGWWRMCVGDETRYPG